MANGVQIVKSEDLVKGKEVRPFRKRFCSILREEPNIKCLILTTILIACISGLLFWCINTQITRVIIDFNAFPITKTQVTSPCSEGSFILPSAFIVMLYLVYLVECWHSKVRIHLSLAKVDSNSVYRRIHEMRRSPPEVFWKIVSFHYNRRTKATARYRNGNAYLSNEVVYERVNSRVSTGRFFYAFCGMRDISPELVDLEKNPITKIKFTKCFVFANDESASEFEEQRSRFLQIQEHYDDYLELAEGMELSNLHFKENLMAWANPDLIPWYGRIGVFWLFSFLLLSWPFRIIVQLNTAHLHYKVTKLFGEKYGNLSVRNFGQLSHQSRRSERRGSRGENSSQSSRRTEELSISIESNEEEEPITPVDFPSTFTDSNYRFVNSESVKCPRKEGGILPRSVTMLMTRPRRYSEEGLDDLDLHSSQNYSKFFEKSEISESSLNLGGLVLLPTYSEALLYRGDEPGRGSSNLWDRVFDRRRSNPGMQLPPGVKCHPKSGNSCEMPPPTYKEALISSRPLFLPALAKIRRCLTERDIAGTSLWLNNITPTFLRPFRWSPPSLGDVCTYSSSNSHDSVSNEDESNLISSTDSNSTCSTTNNEERNEQSGGESK